MPRVQQPKRKWPRAILIALLVVSVLVPTGIFLLNGKTALADTGPDGNYGGAAMNYELSFTKDLTSRNVIIPIYFFTQPVAPVNVTANLAVDGGGTISFDSHPAIGGGISVVYTVAAIKFNLDAASGLYRYDFPAVLTGPVQSDPNYKEFAVSIGALCPAAGVALIAGQGCIGYSSGNTAQFAVANFHRCDFGLDVSGCNKYFNYSLPFAPACNKVGGATSIDIYDPDNPYGATIYNTQPTFFTTLITDTTTGVVMAEGPVVDATHFKRVGNWSNGLPTPPTNVVLKFNFLQGHKYTLNLNGVYANNVLQFKLPFDSMPARVSCDTTVVLTATSPEALPATVSPGDTITIALSLQNVGPFPSQAGVLQVMYPGATRAAGPPAPVIGNLSRGPTPGGFRGANGPAPMPGGANWYWNVPSLPVGALGLTTGTLTFTLPPAAPLGPFTVDVYYAPATLAVPLTHVGVNFKVVSKRMPSLTGSNSDIHAGGGICGGVLTTGNINVGNLISNPKAKSNGEYVVSASGAINGLFSNNSGIAAVPNSLKIGSSGNYAKVCRPDLVGIADAAYKPAGAQDVAVGTPTFVLDGKSGVYYWDGLPGDTLAVSGNVGIVGGSPVTLVARKGGTIAITGNVKLVATSYLAHVQPSFGILALGDINIDPAATQVDAYLFSDNAINTCYTNPLSLVACATPTLVVNGFVMAQSINFQRLGPFNSLSNLAPSYGERIVMNPQLYLNPPMFFDAASVDNTALVGQGEKPPLF